MVFGLMWLWMAAFWIVMVAAAIWAAGRLFPGLPSPQAPTPREILDARTARGELTREQYHRLREEL